jgi:hypothetical protein
MAVPIAPADTSQSAPSFDSNQRRAKAPPHGACPDDRQYETEEVRSPGDLLARNERKQGPIGGGEQKKRRAPDHRGLQVRIVLGMPKAGANGAAELLDRQVPPPALRWTPAKQHPDHAEIAHGVDPERHGKAESAKDHTTERGADGSADIDADAVRSDCTPQALRGNELRHDCLPGWSLDRADHPVEKREQQEVRRRGSIERHDERERARNHRDREFCADQKLSQVHDIRHGAGRNREKKHRQRSRHLHQRHNERVRAEIGHQPARGSAVHPSADVRHDGGDPQRGEAGVPERTQARKGRRCRRRRRAYVAGHAHII